MSATKKAHHTMRGAVRGRFLKLLHYLFNFTNFVIIFQFISFYCVAKCVVFIKKVTFRKSLKVTFLVKTAHFTALKLELDLFSTF